MEGRRKGRKRERGERKEGEKEESEGREGREGGVVGEDMAEQGEGMQAPPTFWK